MDSSGEITRLLLQWKNGDEQALADLLPLVYDELRRLARTYLRAERRDHTLQPTALVHELYIQLASQQPAALNDRAHFFGVAARAMRQLLVAHARRHDALKRGGGRVRVELDDLPASDASIDLEAFDAALMRLEKIDPSQAKIVELRFFCGYTIDETAEIAGCSPATVSREWQLARVFLFRELSRRIR
jgi:RNA polymerase sigma factor (TIGR02999 family)